MMADAPLTAAAFVERLRDEGRKRYHDAHPFHRMMHEGRLSRAQLQAWVLNRYYYQTRIPIKDAILLSRSDDPAWRRMWIHRLSDHDGSGHDGAGHHGAGHDGAGHNGAGAGEGGLTMWLRLAAAAGCDVEEVRSLRSVLPGVRFACDAYVELVQQRPLVEGVASSLTEFFAPDLMAVRLAAWEKHYPWIDVASLDYFRARVSRARRDSEEAIAFVVRTATTREMQERCVEALIRKCEILWSLLDAVYLYYVVLPERGGAVPR